MSDVSRVTRTHPTPPVRRIDRDRDEARERAKQPTHHDRKDHDGDDDAHHEVDTFA